MDALPRARSPLDEESSSQEESMKGSPSIDGHDLRSPIDDGKTLEEEEKTRDGNIVTAKALQALHGEEGGAVAPREETLALLQGVPQGLTHKALGITHE